jgi:hypothetical protein
MRGQPQAGWARLLTIAPGRSWSTWITCAIPRRRRISDERLETIERLEREWREALRSGEYYPEVVDLRRRI